MFLINFYYKMDRNKIRSVLMTPSTHNTQQTFAQSYKKKWVANEDFIECKLIFIWTRVHYYKFLAAAWTDRGITVLVLAPHTCHPLWNLGGAAVPGRVRYGLLQVIKVRRFIVVILLLLAAVVILVVLAAAVLLLAVAEARGVATVVARCGDVSWGEDIADLVLGSPVAGVSSS